MQCCKWCPTLPRNDPPMQCRRWNWPWRQSPWPPRFKRWCATRAAAQLDAQLTTTAARVIREHLKNNSGWHGKSAIIEATGMDAVIWNAAIKELLAEGSVVREGDKKGARYRANRK